MTTHITLKTGGDPRTLPDYAALRDELSKLTHPARPDVNWQYVERRCLTVRTERCGAADCCLVHPCPDSSVWLAGLNEGLAILEALISHQWDVFWPKTHAREILSGLSQRLQQRMRMLPLNNSHLSELYS
jgi:type VI secretion system protein VasL